MNSNCTQIYTLITHTYNIYACASEFQQRFNDVSAAALKQSDRLSTERVETGKESQINRQGDQAVMI